VYGQQAVEAASCRFPTLGKATKLPKTRQDAASTWAENIARLIYHVITANGFPVVEVWLSETPRCHATYMGEK
jgi:hypothetical protein